MIEMFVFQMVCAFGPGLLGLAITAVLAPRIFRRLARMLQFDLTTVMLFTVAFAVLFTIQHAIRTNQPMAGLFVLSIFTVPGLIFARLIIDTFRDERRTRTDRRKSLENLDMVSALAPTPEPEKPQHID
jgi:hypothetical protein